MFPSNVFCSKEYSFGNQTSYIIMAEPQSRIEINQIVANPATPAKDLFDRLYFLNNRYATPFFPDSEPPSSLAFDDARDFILTLPLTLITQPSIYVASDGEVNFQWSGDDFKIDLGFYGDGKFSFYAEKAGHASVVGDDLPVGVGLPSNVVGFAAAS